MSVKSGQKLLRWGLVGLSALLVALSQLRIRREVTPLAGELVSVPPAQFSFSNFWWGKFQSQFDARFSDKFSFRDIWIRAENTLNLKVFNEIATPKMVNPVLLAGPDYLVEKSYINNANGVTAIKHDTPLLTPFSPEEAAAKLGNAVELLHKKGISLSLVFYPHKAWVYPEKLDKKWLLPGGRERAESQYEALKVQLNKNKVPFVDGPLIFSKLKTQFPEIPLFSKGGAHWNDFGACHVVSALIETLRAQSKPALPSMQCQFTGMHLAAGREMDIAQLTNVWDLSRFADKAPDATFSLKGSRSSLPREAFLLGTSFSGEIYNFLKKTGFTTSKTAVPYVYYRHGNRDMHWNEILKKSWIVLEQSQGANLTVNTMEFMDDLVNSMDEDERNGQSGRTSGSKSLGARIHPSSSKID